MTIRFSDLCATEFKRHPHPNLLQWLNEGPLIESKIPLLGKYKLATTYAACDAVLRDRRRFVMEAANAGRKKRHDFQNYLPPSLRILIQNMIRKDEPDHRRLRSLADQAFRNKNVASMRSGIERVTNQLLDECDPRQTFDLVGQFARELPLLVICELLGLPLKDRKRFSTWVSALTHASFPWGMLKVLPGIKKLMRYLRQRIEIERDQPTGGLISELVAAESEGDRLSENELLSMVFLLLVAGHETTTHLISLSSIALMQREDLRQTWLDEEQLRPSAVDELLRYLSPVQMSKPRYVAEDTSIEGVVLTQGEMVIACLASANLDPAKFENPLTIDFARSPNPQLGFGSGIHFCLGAQLARLETEVALTGLFERWPDLQLAEEESKLRWSKKIGMRVVSPLPVCRTEL